MTHTSLDGAHFYTWVREAWIDDLGAALEDPGCSLPAPSVLEDRSNVYLLFLTARSTRMNVLSIQSHVVHGIVGNKAAVFPLMVKGLSVDPLNVCQLSNHTGHGAFSGNRMTGEQVDEISDGLNVIGALSTYDIAITGYVGRKDALTSVARLVKRVLDATQQTGRRCLYLCDPVLGDDGSLYVPADVVPLYGDLLPLSHATTPNGFEAFTLTGIQPDSITAAADCCRAIHSQGPRLVVISSLVGLPLESDAGKFVIAFVSFQLPSGERHMYYARVPKVSGKFAGTGDLLSALVASDLHDVFDGCDLAERFGIWCSTVLDILLATAAHTAEGKLAQSVKGFTELRFGDCIDHLRRGVCKVAVTAVDV
jgi:pyridoxine kinase